MTSTIPFLDLRAQYHSVKADIDRAIQGVLDRGQFILGPEVEALEREVAAYCGVQHAIGVASGTDALELSLRALGIGPGDEVVTTAYSFFATAEAIVTVGAAPVFVDIDPKTFNLDPDAVSAAISPRTKAILPVHLYGQPCEIDRIMALAKRHGLRVVEDCAQAMGATFGGARIGSFGDAGAFSFFPTKNLGGYGDGGMVTTNSAALADQLRLLRAHGSRTKYWHEQMGRNSRLDEIQAAILRVKLRHLDDWNGARRRNAGLYHEAFRQQGIAGLELPLEAPNRSHVYHIYALTSGQRDLARDALTRERIACQVYYPSTLPQQPALSAHVRPGIGFPRAEAAVRTNLALPMYPELSGASIDRIARCVAAAFGSALRPARAA